MTSTKVLVWLPVLGMAVVGVALFSPEFLGYQHFLTFNERTNIFLTLAITMFAAMEGYSTFRLVELEKNRSRIEDVRNELEKAYGTIYSMLSKPEELVKVDRRSKQKRVVLTRDEINELDRILMSYPHMFPNELVALWRKEIRKLKPFKVIHGSRGIVINAFYGIPLGFKEKITEEYNRRLKEYYKITRREKP